MVQAQLVVIVLIGAKYRSFFMKPTLLAALAIMPFAQTATVLSSNTDTALFYLVSSSTNAASNLLVLVLFQQQYLD